MPQFLTTAACNGARPRRVKPIDNQISRPAIIARLMRERHVPRFLVAPTGFGKTAIALEYAETVFRFDKVFWIDGTSPCFLRDLDKGIISSALLKSESKPFLVVVEDIPLLDEERSERFSRDINALLTNDCEVLLTCTPLCDGFERHRDRVVLTSSDLLLSDTELDDLRTPAERERQAALSIPQSNRVAALKWGMARHGHRLQSILDKDINEETSIGLISELFVMLCLKEGSLEEVSSFIATSSDDFAFIEKYYSYMGVCEFDNTFSVMESDFEEIAHIFGPYLAAIADYNHMDKTVLVQTLADRLLMKDMAQRSCDLMRLFAPKAARASWLMLRSESLYDATCLLPAYELFLSLGREALKLEPALVIFQYHCLIFLNDKDQAYGCAERAAKLLPEDPPQRLEALVAMARCCEGKAQKKIVNALHSLLEVSWTDEVTWPFGQSFSRSVMESLVTIAVSQDLDLSEKMHVLASLIMEGVPHKIIVGLAAVMLEDINNMCNRRGSALCDADAVDQVVWLGSTLRSYLDESSYTKLSLGEAWAVAAYEHLNNQVLHQDLPWNEAVSETALRVMESLYEQQAQWQRRGIRSTSSKRTALAVVATPHEATAQGKTSLQGVPEKLTIKLFGGLEVYRGDVRIDPALFSRKNVRILLALLVLNRGREFSRDYLISQMWPTADVLAGRRKFYTVWSILKQALSPTAHECPYLIRQQLGVRLDATLLESDVAELETICHRLLFEGPEYKGWSSIHERVTTTFAEDLMPGVESSPIIESWRKEYRSRLTDALNTASNRLRCAGNIQDALWFAQAAYQREPAREDVCMTLMRAQIDAGQRSAAIATYHACRKSLADELGIDPSLETMNLYTHIIEAEEHLI